jgi:Helix-turn-helix domain
LDLLTNKQEAAMPDIRDPLWNEKEAADYLRASPYFLQKLRSRGGFGPAFQYVGAHVRYRKSELDAYLEENTRKRVGEQLKFTFPTKVKP